MVSNAGIKYVGILQDAISLSNECDINEITSMDIRLLMEEISRYKIVVPIIGAFDAGKSSLLNEFIGGKVLDVDITPETTIATELVYGKEDKLLAYKDNENYVEYPITELGKIDTKDLLFLRLVLNNSILETYQDIILVDMPGLGSGIQAHNKAILNYIDKGINFILLVDIENGSLLESHNRFISEVLSYNQGIDIIIAKSDKKSENDCDAVISNIKSQAKARFGKDIFVGHTSIIKHDIGDFISILDGIDYDGIFVRVFKQRVNGAISKAVNELEFSYKNFDVANKEIEDKIKTLNKQKHDMICSLENEKESINKRLSSSGVDAVLKNVRTSLSSNSSLLANKLKQNNPASLNVAINDILRPVLVNSTEIVLSEAFQDSFDNLQVTINEINEKAGSDFIDLLKTPQFSVSFKSIVGALGLATAVVAPWLEIIILFLPEIIRILSPGIERSQIDIIESEVIPQVLSELRPKISSTFKSVKDDMFNKLQKKLNDDMQILSSLLEEALEQKKQSAEALETKKTAIHNSITEFNKLRSSVQ